MVALTCGELCISTCRTCHCTALSRTQLDVVYECTYRNFPKRKSVADLRSDARAGFENLTYLQSVRSDDVSLLPVLVLNERDTCAAVRVILYCQYCCFAIVLCTVEIDDTVHSLVSATDVTHGHLTGVVASARFLERLKQCLVRLLGGNVVKSADNHSPGSRSYRFEFSCCHCFPP